MNQPKNQNNNLRVFTRWLLLIAVLLGLAGAPAEAQAPQTQKISGRVLDEGGNPVSGASVREKAGRRGTATDAEGKFTLQVKSGATIIITAIGLESQEIAASNTGSLDIHMKGHNAALNEVVVTALGIRREKSQLTYSTQQVKGDALTATKETGILNALAGKVSGVQITSSSGQPGASSRIVIRGTSSLQGNNEALVVLDGVPINNAQNGNAAGVATTPTSSSPSSGVGGSSRLSDIDPSTIESINVLKGSAASALYGSNAARGVVLITTKAGSLDKKPTVTLNSQVSFENPILPEMQTKYALGDSGFKYFDGDINKGSTVWGPPIDSLVKAGIVKYNKNPMKAFFTTGHSYTNTVSIGGGAERSSYFFSYSNLNQTGIVPTTTFKRNAMFAKFTNRITDQITATLQLNFTLSNNHSIPEGYDLTDPLWTVYTSPASWNPLPYVDASGNQRVFRFSRNNPYWNLYNVYNNGKTSRFIPVMTVNYRPATWLSFTERIGADTYSQQADYYEAPSNVLGTVGAIAQLSTNYRQVNHDLIGQVNKQFGDFAVNFLVGNNINTVYNQTHQILGTGTSILNFDNVTNGATIVGKEYYTLTRKIGFYAQANVDYKKFLNVSLTGRYDGTSVLATNKNFYPYGSASAGFIFSELLKQYPAISFGKLRVSYSAVGNDNVGAYSLSTPFTQAASFPYNGQTGFLLSSSLGNPYLVNETTKESEVGLEMSFLHNRVGFEVSYFDRRHNNLLTQNVPIAASTGFSSTSLNSADMTNKGLEVLINASPFKGKTFGWDLTLNYTRIRNKVTRINGGTQQLSIGQTWAFVGMPYGVFYNYGYARDSATHQILIDDGGLPKISAGNVIIGNLQPDFLAGMNNSFYYKNWTLSFFLDYRKGGDILNSDDRYGFFYGTPKVTENRKDLVVKGIVASTKQPNTKVVTAESYYQRLNTIYEAAMQDGTYLKLRQASIGYKLPAKTIAKTPFSQIGLTLTGRNLFIDAPHFTGSDPEVSSYGTSNGSQGVYGNTVPTSRSFNLTLNVVFK